MSFAGLLRQLRTHAGLTQEELADRATLSVRSVSDLERGINLTARRDTTRLLADALNLTGPARTMFEAAARGLAAAADPVADDTEAVPAGAGAAVPAAVGPTAAVHALPRDTASFTGRAPELDQLMTELEHALSGAGSGSVVGVHAIDGMAGIGKTTFAVHAAHLLAPRFPDGQFFLPLHSHTPGQQPADPGAALGTLLLATGIATSQMPDGVDARTMLWRNGLAGKKVLLVLDDAGSHEQVRPLLPGSPGSLVLITSRRRLAALEEATPISLDTLPPADAADLFTRLTARAGREVEAVAEITRLCGYLPLAIRLIAGTVRRHPSWTVTDLAAELASTKDRLAAMRAENLSVAAAFDLSYEDLTEDQQRLFRRLGLHPGTSIDAYAAAALDGTSLPDTRRRLEDLYDHHLITEPARGRYQVHDLLREHARSLAEDDHATDREAAASRLLDYYLYTATAASRLIARRPQAYAPAVTHPPRSTPRPGTMPGRPGR
jgi:transcriptional regulator with XRE-family HTH domain